MATRTTVQITMPAMGESVTEGTVLEWRKQVGDPVELDEPLVEVSTDKVDAEIPAPAAGKLVAIHVEADQVASVGAVLGEIAVENGAGPAADAPTTEAPKPESQKPEAESRLVDVEIPSMGESVSEGTLLEWLVAVGDTVGEQQGLAEVSTDKVDAELPSPVAGVVEELLAQPDDTVTAGQVVERIRAVKGAKPAAKPERKPKAESPEPKADLSNADAHATP